MPATKRRRRSRETVNGWMGNAMCNVYERGKQKRVECMEIGMKEQFQERQAIETKHAAVPQ
jgi:hypothetical protein